MNLFHWTRERLQTAAASLLVNFSGMILKFQFPALAAAELSSALTRAVKQRSIRLSS